MRVFGVMAAAMLLAISLPLHAFGAEPAVEFFSPQGEVKKVRQVLARFSDAMVPFGDPRIEDPFELSCAEKGKGRWADQKNWAYDFDRDLPAGTSCSFTLKPGIRTLSGKRIGGQVKFSFTTGGPAIVLASPRDGNDHIVEDQVFVLSLDATASEHSVLANAYCMVDGLEDRIGITIIKGAARKQLLETVHQLGMAIIKYPDRTDIVRGTYTPADDPAIVVLQCRQQLPNDRNVRLVWGKGISTLSGIATNEDQTLSFKTRTAFSARFSCARENKEAHCIPIQSMNLSFSAPLPVEQAKKIEMKGPGGKRYKAAFGKERFGQYSDEEDFVEEAPRDTPAGQDEPVWSVTFRAPFPENAAFTIELPNDIRDETGRPLVNSGRFPLEVRTGGYPPLAKFSSRFGIIEAGDDAALPVTLRNLEPSVTTRTLTADDQKNGALDRAMVDMPYEAASAGDSVTGALPDSAKDARAGMVKGLKGRIRELKVTREEKIIEWLGEVSSSGRERSLLKDARNVREFGVPKPGGAKAFEVVGIPLKKPGLYVVEIESRILGEHLLTAPDDKTPPQKKPMYVPTVALVTNMAAHFKWGRESSLVWVTSLDKGKPVSKAEVKILDCRGKVHWQGKTDSHGIARIRKQLPQPSSTAYCPRNADHDAYHDYAQLAPLQGMRSGLFAFASRDNDMTFVHSSWEDGIEPWRFQLPAEYAGGRPRAHTIFDRTLLHAGETVHMKHVIRNKTMKGFSLRDEKLLPDVAIIEHMGSDQQYELPLKWSAAAFAVSDWKIPPDAKLGTYRVRLVSGSATKGGQRKSYRHDGLTSGSFRVEEFRLPLMKGSIQPPKEPSVNAAELPVDLMLSYLSGGGAGNASIRLRTAIRQKGIAFDDYEGFSFANGPVKEESVTSGHQGISRDESDRRSPKVDLRELVLDPAGALRTSIGPIRKADTPQEVVAEMEFRDPNGETQTVSRTVPLWNSGVIAGVKPDSWATSKDNFKISIAALDLEGRPAVKVPVKAEIFRRNSYTHRKRLIGGFYAYEHITETKRVGSFCDGITDEKGLLICEKPAPADGNLIIQVEAVDPAGNISSAHYQVWVHDKSDAWFDVGDNDRIDLLPLKKRYEPGETARFQVRMPFRQATVLVTLEREGVLDAFVRTVSRSKPLIDVPLKGNHAPNLFVSALCIRGRVAGSKPTAMIDLAKPAYKLGIAEIKVGWKVHELKVSVAADRRAYRVREKAKITVAVKAADGSKLAKGSEAVIAAVDEALLELMPNESWKLLEAMMARRGYEIRTSTAQMQVVGKRHYGLKALPTGGGGGQHSTRELFDTLLFWKATVKLDEKGEARVEVPLNDSLTSFRIVAVAASGSGRFGSGHTSVRTTQDLMLLSGLPQLVREGDSQTAIFTVRNASDRMIDVDVAASSPSLKSLDTQAVSLKSGEAREVAWKVTVPAGIQSLEWDVKALEKNGEGRDSIKVRQKVIPAFPVRTYQATITQLTERLSLDVERPHDARPGTGGITVTFTPKLAEGIESIREYMSLYPYTCLEQRISQAVVFRKEALWKTIMTNLPSHIDRDGLLKYFPSMLEGSDVLTSYVVAIAHEAGWKIPDSSRERIETGLLNFVSGRITRGSGLPTADLSIRKIAALEALSRSRQITNEQLSPIAVEPNLWPTSAVIDWMNILRRSTGLSDRDRRYAAAEQIFRSRINFQGTVMSFSTEQTDFLWWLMVSADLNAVRGLLTVMDLPSWREDMPRLMRGAVARQHRGHWLTTIANAWGVMALERFSQHFESAPVLGESAASLNHTEKSLDWSTSPRGGSLSFGWPKTRETLAVTHRGSGKPWVTVQSRAAIPLKEQLSTGYKIRKTLTPVTQREKGVWSRGDVVRVKLDIEAQSDMTWVAVNDPIPAGSAILGTGLGRDSRLLTAGEEQKGRVWPAFEERSFESFRTYYRYVPKGSFSVEYTLRLNNEGIFLLPETRVEALYSPEMFGAIPNARMQVKP